MKILYGVQIFYINSTNFSRFHVLYIENYVHRTLRDHIKDEFKALEQGGMSQAAYDTVFHALSRYATELLTIEEERIRLFISELQVLSIHMTSIRKRFNEVIDCVNKVEGVRRDPSS